MKQKDHCALTVCEAFQDIGQQGISFRKLSTSYGPGHAVSWIIADFRSFHDVKLQAERYSDIS